VEHCFPKCIGQKTIHCRTGHGEGQSQPRTGGEKDREGKRRDSHHQEGDTERNWSGQAAHEKEQEREQRNRGERHKKGREGLAGDEEKPSSEEMGKDRRRKEFLPVGKQHSISQVDNQGDLLGKDKVGIEHVRSEPHPEKGGEEKDKKREPRKATISGRVHCLRVHERSSPSRKDL
jgi:hypothetical protein